MTGVLCSWMLCLIPFVSRYSNFTNTMDVESLTCSMKLHVFLRHRIRFTQRRRRNKSHSLCRRTEVRDHSCQHSFHGIEFVF